MSTEAGLEAINEKLLEENKRLLEEIGNLKRDLKKAEREIRINGSFLDKVTKAAEAKDTLNTALSNANIKQRAYTDMLLQSCPSIIILFDSDGRFVLSTEALMSATKTPTFGYIKNRKYEEVFPKYFSAEDMVKFDEAFEKAGSSNEAIQFDASIDFGQTGEPRYYSCELSRAGTVPSNENSLHGILAVMVDLTDFMSEKRRAEDANNAKSDFLASMSHEIRTPLNVIIGMGEMLYRSEMTTNQRKYISDIKKSSESLLSIINDILDFSKIEAGKMELVNANYSLKMLLDNLRSMFSMLCREKLLDLHMYFAEDIPEVVHGDETRLRQILTNLLSNAVKYTKRGSITLTAKRDGSFLLFEIKDTGIGIRGDEQDKLFKPFEQLDLHKNRNVVGTGLGLAITFNLCRMMGGKLWFESVYEKGSTFFVRLPFTEAEEPVCDEIRESDDFVASEAKVLVVDDIEINLDVAKALLSAFEIVPDLAQSGKEAIELAKGKRYDIIFMDHMMPEMDGLETTRFIRGLGGWNSEVPIVALTANAIRGVEQMFLENQFDDFLPKPLELESLSLCLRKWSQDSEGESR